MTPSPAGAALRPDYPVHTERLALRPLTVQDIPDLLAYRGRADVCRWLPFEPMTAEVVAQRLAGPWSRTSLDAEGQSLTLGIEHAGVVIGDVVLFWHSAEHRSGEIGWGLNPEHSGKGYATEAANAVLGFGFGTPEEGGLDLHRIVARIDSRNEASARMARRLGMRHEAHLIENEYFKGGWSDELVFAMLASEWRARR